jgi:hypothetical protein
MCNLISQINAKWTRVLRALGAESPAERILGMMLRVDTDNRNFPATILYNEGWLLRLVLDWFSQRENLGGFPQQFAQGARWFSEALLPSQFLARYRGDPLAETHTHADGVVGHFTIGTGAKADTALADGASQFLVTEAKLFSPLSAGVTRARNFDQAARNVACIAEVLFKANRPAKQLESLGFFVLAPSEQIDAKLFEPFLSKGSIYRKVWDRVSAFDNSPDKEPEIKWFRDWFEPTLEQITINSFSWEEIMNFIASKDREFGPKLSSFYDQYLVFNRPPDPQRP